MMPLILNEDGVRLHGLRGKIIFLSVDMVGMADRQI